MQAALLAISLLTCSATVNVKVVSEMNAPVEGANVTIRLRNGVFVGGPSITNRDGLASIEIEETHKSVLIRVQKFGYIDQSQSARWINEPTRKPYVVTLESEVAYGGPRIVCPATTEKLIYRRELRYVIDYVPAYRIRPVYDAFGRVTYIQESILQRVYRPVWIWVSEQPSQCDACPSDNRPFVPDYAPIRQYWVPRCGCH